MLNTELFWKASIVRAIPSNSIFGGI